MFYFAAAERWAPIHPVFQIVTIFNTNSSKIYIKIGTFLCLFLDSFGLLVSQARFTGKSISLSRVLYVCVSNRVWFFLFSLFNYCYYSSTLSHLTKYNYTYHRPRHNSLICVILLTINQLLYLHAYWISIDMWNQEIVFFSTTISIGCLLVFDSSFCIYIY